MQFEEQLHLNISIFTSQELNGNIQCIYFKKLNIIKYWLNLIFNNIFNYFLPCNIFQTVIMLEMAISIKAWAAAQVLINVSRFIEPIIT